LSEYFRVIALIFLELLKKGRLETMEKIVEILSDKEPYLGSLSYKFTGVYLLHGYAKFPNG